MRLIFVIILIASTVRFFKNELAVGLEAHPCWPPPEFIIPEPPAETPPTMTQMTMMRAKRRGSGLPKHLLVWGRKRREAKNASYHPTRRPPPWAPFRWGREAPPPPPVYVPISDKAVRQSGG